jgi:hypothetical protein
MSPTRVTRLPLTALLLLAGCSENPLDPDEVGCLRGPEGSNTCDETDETGGNGNGNGNGNGKGGNCDSTDPAGRACNGADACQVSCSCGSTTGGCDNGACVSAADACNHACGDGWDGDFCFVGGSSGGGGGNPGGGGGDPGGDGGDDEPPPPPPPPSEDPNAGRTECCSLFDCGATISCPCGEVQGCNIQGNDECGFCYVDADCDADCASRQ